MHQTFDAFLDLDERAIVGEVGHLAEHAGALRITAGNADPRIVAELLEPERNAVLLGVVTQNLGFQFLADVHHFGRMLDTTPGHVGDVQQTVDAAQIHERAVVGDVLDHALDDGTFLQAFEQSLAVGAHGLFQHGATRHDDVVALAVELDDLELHFLVFVGRGVLDRPHVDQRTGQEGAQAGNQHRQTALDLALHHTADDAAFVHRRFEIQPCGQTLGAVARQLGRAEAVLDGFDGDRDEIADLGFDFAGIVLEFLDRDQALGLEAGVHRHEIVVDGDDLGGDDLALAHFLMGERLLEQGGKAFHGSGSGSSGCG